MRMSVRLVCFFIYTSTKFYIPGGGVSGLHFMPTHSYTALLYAPSKKRDSSSRASVFFVSCFLAHAAISALDTIHIFYRSHSRRSSFGRHRHCRFDSPLLLIQTALAISGVGFTSWPSCTVSLPTSFLNGSSSLVQNTSTGLASTSSALLGMAMSEALSSDTRPDLIHPTMATSARGSTSGSPLNRFLHTALANTASPLIRPSSYASRRPRHWTNMSLR